MKLRSQRGSRFAVLLNGLIISGGIVLCACGLEGQDAAPSTAADPAVSNQAASEARFPVALQHSGSWCYGYLYASQERIRFEVVQPQSGKSLSFDVPRAEVTTAPLVILGMAQDAVVLRARGATYIMRWLANEGEVNTGAPRRWGPPNSLPPDALIAAMQNPGVALAQGTQRPGPVVKTGNPPGGGSPPPGGSPIPLDNQPQNVPSGMLAGVYVATAGPDARPSNKQYLFYPDGFVLNAVPQTGLLGFDLNHYRRQDNRDNYRVGRYKVEGDTVKILWIDEYTDPANPDEIQRNETFAHPAVRVGPPVFIPMCQCTGKALSGTYLWGPPMSGQYIQFLPDGTFIDNRATDQLLAISFDHPRIQRGRYQIVGQTIIFTFLDGHRGTSSFLAPKAQQNDPTFEWIDMGWNMVFEQSYQAKLSRGW